MKLGELEDSTALLVCGHVFDRSEEIRMVIFDDEGPQAVCGHDHHEDDTSDQPKLVALHHLFDWEEGLDFLKELQLGQLAWKTGPNSWEIEWVEQGDNK